LNLNIGPFHGGAELYTRARRRDVFQVDDFLASAIAVLNADANKLGAYESRFGTPSNESILPGFGP
jgi:hypothetical protein